MDLTDFRQREGNKTKADFRTGDENYEEREKYDEGNSYGWLNMVSL